MTTARLEGQQLTLMCDRWRCAIGRGGISDQKREGDGATPRAFLPLRRVLYRADRGRAPHCAVPVEPIGPADGWCDDPSDAAYNRPVTLPYPGRHEVLWRDDSLYDIIGVLGWNDDPVVSGRGSAIFLHVARPDYAPTEGCVALAPLDLRAALAAGLTAIEVL
ncbi:MAG TPA: L,D-transpeptidase family protein [Roseomonas sp.]|jgi:L,D-peptidoglycan transpeptidase YkuD (ErfK/YbiS/YcfS/YnhG family)